MKKGVTPKRERDITDRNPLTDAEVAELAVEVVGLDFQLGPQLLLLLHAFTHEMSYSQRELMMHAAAERLAVTLPGFDSMMMESMAGEVAALRAREGGRR